MYSTLGPAGVPCCRVVPCQDFTNLEQGEGHQCSYHTGVTSRGFPLSCL